MTNRADTPGRLIPAQALVETTADALFAVSVDGEIRSWNTGAASLLGFEAEEAIGHSLVELLLPADQGTETRRRLSVAAESGGTVYETVCLRKNGTEFPVEISLSPLETEEETLVSSTIRDITERNRTGDALLQSAEPFRLLVESVKDYAILMLDPEGRVVSWNLGAQRIKGYQAEEIIGRHFSCFYAPEDAARGKPGMELRTAAEEGRFEDEGWRVRKDGSRFWANVVITALRGETGQLRGFAKVTRDVTQKRVLEEQLRHKNEEVVEQYRKVQEANRLKSEFLANMSHELRTPLNAIIGFAELMHDEKVGPVSADQKEYLGDILTSSRHLLQLINDILDLSKVESGKIEFRPEPVDLARIVGEVRDIVRTLAAQKRLQIEMTVDPSLKAVVTDPAKLKQILYNYVSNALKFSPDGGRIHIRVAAEGSREFRIEVEDAGIGISPEDIGRLFVEFQQLDASMAKKHPGTGLGLALTKRIVEAQGGRVGVQSTPGKGSLFFAILPVAPPILAKSGTEPEVVAPLPGGRRILMIEDDPKDPEGMVSILAAAGASEPILIVDDNPANLKLARVLLASEGYEVRTAGDAEQALAVLKVFRPRLILMDIQLPGMDGLELTRKLKADPGMQDVVILALTGYAMRGDEERALVAGCDGYVAKPIDTRRLPERVAEFLRLPDKTKVPAAP